MSHLQSLLDELKRRRVFRVAAAYAVVAFVIWQAADFVLPALKVPDWVATTVVILTLLGFPVVLALAWAFDVTPEGVRRTEPAVGQTVAGQSRARVNLGAATLIVAFVILAGAVSVWFLASRDSGSALVRERIAVVPFENRTGDPARDELGTMAAEWISAGLAQAGAGLFEVVPMRVVNQYLEASSSGDELRGLADYSRSRTLLTGSFYLQGDSIEFHAEILDAQPETPALIYAVPTASGPADDPMAAIETVRERVGGALIQHLDWDAGSLERVSPPPSLEAYREARKGTELFTLGEMEEASVHYHRALELDSTYLVAVWVLAFCYLNLGENAKADSLLRVYESQRSRFMMEERVWADYLRGSIDGDLDLKYRAAQEWLRINPLNGPTVYTAARAALRSNRPAEAVRHVSQREPTAWSTWRGWWYVHLNALHMLGRHDRELEVAREARVAHPDHPNFSELEAWALAALGRLDELRDVLDEIARQTPQSGYNAGIVMRRTAVELQAHGHEEAAAELLERAIGFYESRLVRELAGDPPAAWYREQLAQVFYHAGRWSEAVTLLDELASEHPDDPWLMGLLGQSYARLGEREKALEYSALLGAVEGEYLYGSPIVLQARIASLLGESERAVILLRQGFEKGHGYGPWTDQDGSLWPHQDDTLWSLRDYPPFQEFIRPKG